MSLKRTLNSVNTNSFLVEIYGLGYVGLPLAVRLAKSGLKVKGIDVNPKRLERLQSNSLFESERVLIEDYVNCRKEGRLRITNSPKKEKIPKIGIICVPTPIPTNGIKSNVYVKAAVENFLTCAKKGDVIILESSIEVGTTEEMSEIIHSKGFKVGEDFGLCFCPERIDPANKEWGIENIPRVIYCSDDISYEIARKIYENVNGANLIRVESPKIAEVIKSFENAFRLVNISLVNELAMLCDKLGINVRKVIEAAATKPFGFMSHYPSAGAGGHCIPKDPRFLLESAKKSNSNFGTIQNALKINSMMPTYVCNAIEKTLQTMNLKKSVLICGLSYKANVEDMRDSAGFKIATELKKRGFTVQGYDPFFKKEFLDKYLVENGLTELNFEVVPNIDDSVIKNVSCICIVQHHDKTKERIKEIYKKSLVPLIYDCQNKFEKVASNTVLECLGSVTKS